MLFILRELKKVGEMELKEALVGAGYEKTSEPQMRCHLS